MPSTLSLSTADWMPPLGALLAAALITGLATPACRRLALGRGIVDRPGEHRRHERPRALLGGVAIYLGILPVTLLLAGGGLEPVVAITATAIFALGLWDDSMPLPASLKLVVELAAAVALLQLGIRTQLPLPEPVNVLITLVWIVGITNAFNLIDNMDGLAAGAAAIASASFLLLALASGQSAVAILAAATLGATLGFLPFNLEEARIFMGDAGSLFLGFLLAVLGLDLRFPWSEGPRVSWMVPVLVLGLPVFDTVLVTVSRLKRGSNPLTTPGNDHLSHRLERVLDSGRRSVVALYLVSLALAVAAIVVSASTLGVAYAIAGVLGALAVAALVRFERLATLGRKP